MELHELEVRDAGAAMPREGDAVTRGNRRVGGLAEHVAGTAGGEQHRGCFDRVRAVVILVGSTDASTASHQQSGRARMAFNADPRLLRHLVPEGAANFTTGGVGRMHHPAQSMCAFAAKRQFTGGLTIEARTSRHQLTGVANTIFHQDANCRRHAQPIACRDCVGGMQIG